MDYRNLLGTCHSDLSAQGYEDIVECPYNRAHQIMQFRMQTHLYKCRKNYKDLKYVKCPFNETHDLPEQELQLHIASCPDKESFDRYKYCISTAAATFVPDVASTVAPPVVDSSCMGELNDESWEPEGKLRAYNADAYAKRSNVIRKCTGMAPSVKKAFKEAERQRFQEMGRRYQPRSDE